MVNKSISPILTLYFILEFTTSIIVSLTSALVRFKMRDDINYHLYFVSFFFVFLLLFIRATFSDSHFYVYLVFRFILMRDLIEIGWGFSEYFKKKYHANRDSSLFIASNDFRLFDHSYRFGANVKTGFVFSVLMQNS